MGMPVDTGVQRCTTASGYLTAPCPPQQKAQGRFPRWSRGSSHTSHNKYSSSLCVVIEDGALAIPKGVGCIGGAPQKSQTRATSERLAA